MDEETPLATFRRVKGNTRTLEEVRVYRNRVEEDWRGLLRLKSRTWPLRDIARLTMRGAKSVSAVTTIGTGAFDYWFRKKEEAREFYSLVSSLL